MQQLHRWDVINAGTRMRLDLPPLQIVGQGRFLIPLADQCASSALLGPTRPLRTHQSANKSAEMQVRCCISDNINTEY